LRISGCPQLEHFDDVEFEHIPDIGYKGEVESVNVISCDAITHTPPIACLGQIYVSACPAIKKIGKLKAYRITLNYCNGLERIAPGTRCVYLKVTECSKLAKLPKNMYGASYLELDGEAEENIKPDPKVWESWGDSDEHYNMPAIWVRR